MVFLRSSVIEIEESITSNLPATSAGMMPSKSWLVYSHFTFSSSQIALRMSMSKPTNLPLASIDKFVGFDIDIMNAICDELKVKCEYINQDFDGIIPALVAGKFDVIDSSISITEERKKTIGFTDKVYNTPPAIVARKDAGIKGIGVDDLAGKAIGVQSSTTHANYAQKTYTKSDIKLYPSSDQFKLDLANGRLDAANDDIMVFQDWLKSPEGSECCVLVGTVKPVPEIHGIGAGFG